MTNPVQILRAVAIRDDADPALNISHPAFASTAAAYDRARSPETLDALLALCRDGQRPVVFHLRPLTLHQLAFVEDATNAVTKMERAFRCAIARVDWPDGTGEDAPTAKAPGAVPQCEPDWSEVVVDKVGVAAVQEMAALALRRKAVSPRAADPYASLPGAPVRRHF